MPVAAWIGQLLDTEYAGGQMAHMEYFVRRVHEDAIETASRIDERPFGVPQHVGGLAELRAVEQRQREVEPDDDPVRAAELFEQPKCFSVVRFGVAQLAAQAGFAIMAFNPAALSFAVWTAANLVPRALSHHQWYRGRFPDYPEGRKALVPGLL